jgi:polyferredoxin
MSWFMSKKSFLALALSFRNEADRNERTAAIKCFVFAWFVFSIPALVVVSVGFIFLDTPSLLLPLYVTHALLVAYMIMTVNLVVDFVRHGTVEDE